jgi:hypothetical protein
MLRENLLGRKLAVSFGGGVDSTALLCALHEAGIRPDVITFANVKREKKLTYRHVERMQPILESWGFPQIDIVQHTTKEDTGYTDLAGNCFKNETMPSLAFGGKSCSIKWKIIPQEQFLMGVASGPNKRPPHALWTSTQAGGERIVKLLGYDDGPADIRRSKNLADNDENFDYVYILQLLKWGRGDCVKAIVIKLGADMVPIKSACSFCPASKIWELFWLAANEPEMLEEALDIEYRAMTGRHSRFNATAYGGTWETIVETASTFRKVKTDDRSVLGLGRTFSWCQWARVNGVVDRDWRVRRDRLAEFAARAEAMLGNDNALDVRSCEANAA